MAKILFIWKALLVPVMAIICWLGFPSLLTGTFSVSSAAADHLSIHDAPLEESVDFYQYTDEERVIHFVDSPEKIPLRYRGHAVVRKDIPSAQQVTRIVIKENQVHIPVTFNTGKGPIKAIMLLDTGASITCITEELAARLNIDENNSRPSTTHLADGSEIPIRLAIIDSIRVGNKLKAHLEIGIMRKILHSEVHDGLLGIDFLNGFQYQVDLANGLIRWQ